MPRAILLSARWLEDIFPVSHSTANSFDPTAQVASILPGSFTVAMSTGVSEVHPRLFRFSTKAFLMGPTPFPSPLFFPDCGNMVNFELLGGQTTFAIDS